MAAIMFMFFTRAGVAKLLGLADTQAVERLIATKQLEIAAYTRRGLPLFDVDTVRRAAERVVSDAKLFP
jgi:hypothetical protein